MCYQIKNLGKVAIQYYAVSLSLYCLEILLVYFALFYLPFNALMVNFLVRLIACSLALFIYKNYILNSVENLYRKYFFVVTITPLMSSLLIFLISAVSGMDFLIIKIGSDIILSLIGFFILSRKKPIREI